MGILIPHQDVTPPPANSLADKVANTFASAGQRLFGGIAEQLSNVIASAGERFLESVEPEAIADTSPIIDLLQQSPDLPPEVRQYLNNMRSGTHPLPAIILAGIGMVVASVFGMVISAFMGRKIQYAVNRRELPARLGPGDLILAVRQGVLTSADALSQLADQGYKAEYLQAFTVMLRSMPNTAEIATAMFRGTITETDALDRLHKLGYNDADTTMLKALFPVLPGVNDLISMAVKEAFTPEIAEKFGQYQDFPPRFAEEAAKQGLSTEWARAYWAAHWSLPSPSQGYEMLHRGLITGEDLKLLLRALDVMPYWREPLIGISYNPYTRVDTRRMYDAKIIDRAGVKRSYLDQGYDDVHAENLTIWTTKERAADEREYTRADILNGMIYGLMTEAEVKTRLLALDYAPQQVDFIIALKLAQSAGRGKTPERALQKADLYAGYIQGLLTRGELAANLASLGYDAKEVDLLLTLADTQKDKPKVEANKAIAKSEILTAYRDRLVDRAKAMGMLSDVGYEVAEVDFLISIADYQLERDRIDDKVNTLHILFVNGFKTEADVMTELNSFNLADTTVQNLTYKWGFERDAKAQHPTLSQLIQFYKAKVIDQATLVSELQGLNYPDKYIAWYLALIVKQTTVPA